MYLIKFANNKTPIFNGINPTEQCKIRLVTSLFFSVWLVACSSDPEKPKIEAPAPPPPVAEQKPEEVKPKATAIDASIQVSEKINPDTSGRASPVVMRIYELKNLGKFQSADFYKLSSGYEAVLGSDLVASEQFHLHPGENKILKHDVTPDTQYIAVTVAYRNLNKAIWRASLPLTANTSNHFTIRLEALKVSFMQ